MESLDSEMSAETASRSGDSKETIAEIVREMHQSTVSTGCIDPKILEKDDVKFVFHGTEDELCGLIKEVVMEDEETLAYAKKTEEMLNKWALALEKEEG